MIPVTISPADMSGWRSPLKSELTLDSSLGKERGDSLLRAQADFNGDSKIDVANILINDKENKMGLFVELGGYPGQCFQLDEINDKSWAEIMGISIAKPGNYKTACGKGYWKCKKNEPGELELKLPAIDYFKEGSASSFFIWDKKEKTFNRIWMSD